MCRSCSSIIFAQARRDDFLQIKSHGAMFCDLCAERNRVQNYLCADRLFIWLSLSIDEKERTDPARHGEHSADKHDAAKAVDE